MTEGEKESRKLFANLLNGIAVGSISGSTITPVAAYIIGTSTIVSPNWWNVVGFVVFVWVAAGFLHYVAQQFVKGIA